MSHRFSSRHPFLDRCFQAFTPKRRPVLSSRRHARSLEVLEARIAPAAAIGATKVDVFAPGGDVNGDGQFQPGDTILYTVTISNNGDVDLTGVTFNDIIDPNTTLGAVNVSPLAINDSFTAVGNTLLEVGVTHGASPAAIVSGSVFSNDAEFLGDTFTLSTFQSTSANSGTVAMNANGTFTYLPAAGFTGPDTFTYTIKDKGLDNISGNADDLTSVGTVTITVQGVDGTSTATAPVVWYVDNSYTGANGASDGRSTRPFTSITATNLNGAGGAGDVDGAGDLLFLHTGTGAAYASGLKLETSQTFQGQGNALVVNGFNLVAAGTAPTIVNAAGVALDLGTDNVLRGFTAGNSSDFGISGASFGTLNVSNVTINKTGPGLRLLNGSFAAGSSFNSITAGGGTNVISLDNVNGTGLIGLGGGALSGASGAEFFVLGGNAQLLYSGTVTNTAGRSVDISGHSTGNITLSGNLDDTGTGVSILNNPSGTIAFTGGSKTINTGTSTAVTYTGNGASFQFIGGNLDIDTTSGGGINASGNAGAFNVTGTNNTITSQSGTALNVTNTVIGTLGLTFQNITAGTAANSAGSGIILDTTGNNAGLTVTGTGSAGTGGTIQHKTGANGTSAGVGIFLNNTQNVSLSRMQLNDFGNFGIKGNNVTNFSFISGVINSTGGGFNGDVAGEGGVGEGSIRFDNLLGTAAITDSTITGGFYDNIGIFNTSGTLNRLTITGAAGRTIGSTSTNGNDALRFEHSGTAVAKITVTGVTFTAARGDIFDAIAQPGANLDVVFTNNTVSNNNTNIASGGGGFIVHGGGTVTFDVSSNTFRDARGRALNISKAATAGTFSGTINGNTIGAVGAVKSGSLEGEALFIDGGGAGSMNVSITNNIVQQYNDAGIRILANNQAVPGNNGKINATVTGNTLIAYSGTGTIAYTGIFADIGAGAGVLDATSAYIDINGNDASLGDPFNAVDIQISDLTSTSIRLPGYAGGAEDGAAVAAYLKGRNLNSAATATGATNDLGNNGYVNGVAFPLMFAPTVNDTVTVTTPVVGGQTATPVIVTPVSDAATPTVQQPPVIVDDGILSQAELDSLVGAAIARWEATGLTEAQVDLLQHVTFSVQDLPGWYLGSAAPGHITLDRNAAGNSWFIDATPNDDSEFAGSLATANGGAAGRIDALTTVLHELGHQLGLDDTYATGDRANLMYGYINQSERRLPGAHQADGATPHLVQGEMDFAVGPLNIGSLPVGKSVQVVFTAQINSNNTAPTITNQGTVSSTQTGSVQTDDPSVIGTANPTVTPVDFPDVNLAIGATTSVAEDGGGNFIYTFTRQGPLTNALTVHFNVTGGAVFTSNALTDYTQSGAATFGATAGTVTFLANSSTASVTITPRADTITENNETVVLTLATGAGYDVATTGSIAGSGTIVNDDTTVFVSGTPGSVAEDGGGTLVYTFKRAGVLTNALTVNLNISGAAAFTADYAQAGGATYNATAATVTFAPGSDTATITLTPIADSTVEPDETVQMTVASGSGYNVDAELNSLTGTIANDDATVAVSVSPLSIAEDAPNGNSLVYTFTRSGFIANAVTVNFTASGSATKDTDYSVNGASFIGLAGTVTFAPNSTVATVTVDPTADATGELDETVIFTVNSGTGYAPAAGPSDAATGTILNDDTSISVAVSGSSVGEGVAGAVLTYTFSRTGDNSTPLTINFSAGGSASFTNDYALSGANTFSTSTGLGTLTFAAGSSTAAITLTPGDDTLVEGTEDALIFVNTGAGYGVGASPAFGQITDNDTASVAFASLTSSAAEGGTDSIAVTLTTFGNGVQGAGTLQNDFTVYVIDLGGGTATEGGVDYTFNGQSLTFPAGEDGLSIAFFVPTTNDTLSEGSETFRLGLSSSGNMAPGGFSGDGLIAQGFAPPNVVTIDPTPHVATIVDNDIDLTVTVDSPITNPVAGFGAGNVSFTFSVENTGLTDATNIDFSGLFTLPSGVTAYSATPSSGTFVPDGNGGSWSIPSLAVDGLATLTVSFTAGSSTAGGTLVEVNGTADSADQTLVNTADDSGNGSATVNRQSDLVLTKIDSPDPVGPGAQLTYTITVFNAGPSDNTLASVTDLLPVGFSNATWTSSVNGASGSSGTGDVEVSAAIPAQGNLEVTITGTVTAASNTSFTNTASVNSSEETDFSNNTDSVTTFVGGVDLKLTKAADVASATPGTLIKYTLTYRNGGFITAEGVKIEDTIPANTAFDLPNSTAGWQDTAGNPLTTGAAAGTAILFPIGSLAVSESGTSIVLAVRVTGSVAAFANTVDNAANIEDDGAAGADITPGDNSADASSTLVAAPDLKLLQAADRLLIIRGQTLLTTYSYSNEGNQDASDVRITATLPVGTSFDAGQSTSGWSPIDATHYVFGFTTLVAQSSGSVIFAVTVNTTRVAGHHQVDTTATIDDAGANGADPTPGNNTAANTVLPTKIYEGIYAVSQGIAVAGKFGLPTVRVFDPVDGHELFHFNAYETKYRASVRVAVADMNGDGFDDIITTSGIGTGRLRVFNGLTGVWFHDDPTYEGPFKNEIAVFSGRGIDRGAFVAAGDLTGDGRADIVVGTALGGNKVRVFDGLSGQALTFGGTDTFLQPFGKTFRGGVRVAVGDVLGDLRADLAVAMGFYGSQVKIYDAAKIFGFRGDFAAQAAPAAPAPPVATIDFKVGPANYRGGLSIALGDQDGDGRLDLITGRNWSKPTLVETFSGLLKDAMGKPAVIGAPINPFDLDPAKPRYALGVRVAAIDINFDGIADIIAGSGGNNNSRVHIYSGADHTLLRTFQGMPQTPNSALFVAGTAVSPVVRFLT